MFYWTRQKFENKKLQINIFLQILASTDDVLSIAMARKRCL